MCIACPLKSFENTGFITYGGGGGKLRSALLNPNLLIFKIMVMGPTFKSSYFQDYGYGSNIQIFLFSRLCYVSWYLSAACMAWFGEKIWSWVGIPTPEGRWVFLHVLGSSSIFKNLPGFRFL